MFEGIVRHQKKYLLIIASGLILAWLVLDPRVVALFSRSRGGSAAEIFGKGISERELARVAERWSRYLGKALDEKEALWRVALVEEARRMGLRVGRREVDRFLTSQFGKDGVLSAQDYREILERSNMTREDFERCVEENLLLVKMTELVASSVKVTDLEAWQDYKAENTIYRVKYVALPVETFVQEVEKPTEDEVLGYFDSHKEDFRIPERVRLEALSAPYEEVKKTIAITEEEARDYYEMQIERFRVKSESSQKGAAEKGETPSASTSSAPSEPQKPDAEESGVPGDVEAPDIYEPFEKVRGGIIETLKAERARYHAADIIEEALFRLSEGSSLEEVRKDYPLLTYTATEAFSAGELEKAGGVALAKSERDGKPFSEFAFNLSQGAWSPLLSGEEGAYAFRVLERHPSGIPPFETVKEKAVEAVLEERARARCLEKAKALVESAHREVTSTLEELVASVPGLEIKVSEPFGSRDAPPFTRQALELAVGEISQPISSEKSFYLVQMVEKTIPEKSKFRAEAEPFKNRLLQVERFLFQMRWQQSFAARAGMKVFEKKSEEPHPRPVEGHPAESPDSD